VAFGIQNNQIISPKKSKIEFASEKGPLNQVTNTSKASGSRNPDASDMFYEEDARTKLENVKLAIAGQQHLMERLKRKFHLTQEDSRCIKDCENEVDRLRAIEQAYESTNPSYSQWIKPEIQEQYFPMEVDQKPDVSAFKWEWEWEDRGSYTPIASSSRIPSSPIPQPPPQTDGSLPMRGDEDLSNSDYIIDQFGISAPPPIIDHAHDENGDFHGRGRDLFVGPQAAVNE